MGRQVVGLTTQRVQYTIDAVGTVSDPYCETDPEDCCSGSGTDCCPDPEPLVEYFSSWPTLDPEVFVDIDGELELNPPPGQVYTQVGGERAVENVQLTFKMVCAYGVWYAVGTVNYLELGPIYFNVIMDRDENYLFADVEIPGYGTGTIAVFQPCSSGSGSGGGSGSGVDACGCTNVPTQLYAHFAGALAAYGTVTLTYVNPLLGWVFTPAGGVCNAGNSPIAFNCLTGSTWRLSSPGSGAPPSTTWSADATATSCSPLSVSFSGTATGDGCPGPWSAVVDTVP